jgi:hypothetical protein
LPVGINDDQPAQPFGEGIAYLSMINLKIQKQTENFILFNTPACER